MAEEQEFQPDFGPALLARRIFEPVTQRGSASISDAKLHSISQFLDTNPPGVAHLQPKPDKKDWLATLRGPRFEAFGNGIATTRYHLDRVDSIEAQITAIAGAHETALFGDNHRMTIGIPSLPLASEYQAFAMAHRRTFEYLAGVVSAYFKMDGTRIRGLAEKIADKEPQAAATAAAARLETAGLNEMIGDPTERLSVRDRLAHFEWLSPGVVNIGKKPDGSLWVRLHGEAEDLNRFEDGNIDQTETLSRVLSQRVERLESLAFGLFDDLGLVR